MAHEGNHKPIGRLSPAARELRRAVVDSAPRATLIEDGPVAGRR